jgi:hypothetical protein
MNAPRDLAIPLQRITWRDGQALTSRDLRDDRGYGDRLRHLHIRYQHKTWGVVGGLDVLKAGDGVTVNSGYALDIEGRELLWPNFAAVTTPSNFTASTTMYLVISRNPAPGCCTAGPDLTTLCPGVRNPIPIEHGLISWKTVNEVRIGNDVLLARALVAGGKVASAVDTSIQRRAASMYRPLMWYDVTVAGQTGWSDGPDGPLTEIEATVDTSDAGFIATPAYFAYLAGTAASGFISSASPTSFTFVVRPAGPTGLDATVLTAATAELSGWTISWLGVELARSR